MPSSDYNKYLAAIKAANVSAAVVLFDVCLLLFFFIFLFLSKLVVRQTPRFSIYSSDFWQNEGSPVLLPLPYNM